VVLSIDPPSAGAILKIAAEQGVGIADGVTYLAAPASYFPQAPMVLGPDAQGLNLIGIWEPYESATPEVNELLAA
jgi:hypothetical protein